MKVKHMPAALIHNPRFVLRRAHKMAAHIFRGATLKTFLGWKMNAKPLSGIARFARLSAHTSRLAQL